MRGGEGDCCVVVVGAGAAGALTASHLVTSLSPRYRVALVDPSPTTGRGPAYSTSDDRHLLNVPASGMSAFPRDPEHFFRWVRNHHERDAQPQDFIPRRVYGDYIHSLLQTASEYPGNARLERREEAVVGVARRKDRFTVRLSSGQTIVARAVVLATGSSPGIDWAPAGLSSADVADPWTEELPDGDLLLVGTGLTMVDVAIAADRPGRKLHTVSRHDLVPTAHRLPTTPMVPPPPGITRIGTLQELQRVVDAHIEQTIEETGDWRAAVDGLRPVTAQLWQGLCEEDKRRFRDDLARTWEIHRHRMSPETASRLDAIADSGRLVRHTGTVGSARRRGTGLEVTLTDGSRVTVAGLVNCTGPVGRLAKDPLLASLAHTGLVRPGPSGLGIDTADDGRVLGVLPARMPLYALGALRRGNLWETTAMPEIREQAYDVARSVVRGLHGETRRRPSDVYGLTLTTDRRAADAYNKALGRLLRLQDGVEEGLEQATSLDPGFAHAHAALALMGHEWGAAGSWRRSLAAAHAAAADHDLDDREVSFLDAVTVRLRSDEPTGAAALLRHVRLFPRDALAVSVAVPTVAFGGLTSGRQTANLVEGLGRSYGDDWWYAGQLAFVRQDQERWDEAESLASYALSVEPSSGHAVHARAHVFYETGQHAAGLAWLDEWIRTHGPEANHRSHFSWHAALHELGQCDIEAVQRRYERELAPPLVSGSRVLVDSGALLWRLHVNDTWEGELPASAVRDSAPDGWLITPPTAFAALHSALTLAAASDPVGLAALRTTSLAHADPTFRDVVAPVCCALQSVVEGEFGSAATQLTRVLPTATALGGSAAQRDVLQDTLVYALARSGQGEQAAAVLDERLSRRASPLDARQRARIKGGQYRETGVREDRGAASRAAASAPAWAAGGRTQPRPGLPDRG